MAPINPGTSGTMTPSNIADELGLKIVEQDILLLRRGKRERGYAIVSDLDVERSKRRLTREKARSPDRDRKEPRRRPAILLDRRLARCLCY
jgi:hypothetical protein